MKKLNSSEQLISMGLLSLWEFPGSGKAPEENPLHSVFPEKEKYFLEFWSAVERTILSEKGMQKKKETLKRVGYRKTYTLYLERKYL